MRQQYSAGNCDWQVIPDKFKDQVVQSELLPGQASFHDGDHVKTINMTKIWTEIEQNVVVNGFGSKVPMLGMVVHGSSDLYTVLYTCTLYCTVMYCTPVHCTVLYCNV